MNDLYERDYEDVSFFKQHPTIKGIIITLVCVGAFMVGAGFNKLITPNPEDQVKSVIVEIEQKGKLEVAEANASDSDVATSNAKIGPIPLWYDNSIEYSQIAKSIATYDLDQTKITANTLTKTVTVKAPKVEIETHLITDTYKKNKENQTIFNPVSDENLNKSKMKLEKKLNEAAKKSDLPQKAKTSFEDRMTKLITDLAAYKDYKVKFKYA